MLKASPQALHDRFSLCPPRSTDLSCANRVGAENVIRTVDLDLHWRDSVDEDRACHFPSSCIGFIRILQSVRLTRSRATASGLMAAFANVA